MANGRRVCRNLAGPLQPLVGVEGREQRRRCNGTERGAHGGTVSSNCVKVHWQERKTKVIASWIRLSLRCALSHKTSNDVSLSNIFFIVLQCNRPLMIREYCLKISSVFEVTGHNCNNTTGHKHVSSSKTDMKIIKQMSGSYMKQKNIWCGWFVQS